MKVKVDHVTNSSSEAFGVVIADSALVIGAGLTLAALFKGCSMSKETNQDVENVDIGDSQSIADAIAKGVIDDANKQEQIVKDAYDEATKALDEAENSLSKELNEVQKQWAESETTVDKNDPGYDDFKKQYTDYMDYLKSQIEKTKYEKEVINAEKLAKQAEIDSKSEWVKMNQNDYIAVKEEKAMLEAVAKGYNVPGYNTDAVKQRLEQLNQREKELNKVLKENNADFEYQAKDRGEIGPSKESLELTEKIRKEKEEFKKASEKADADKRIELEKKMQKNIEEMKKANASAHNWDLATKAAEGVQWGADAAIEGLSHVTGPAGKTIKTIYGASKGVASGMGEGMADPKNAAKHLAKGILNGASSVVSDKFGDSEKPWQQAATSILNEGLQAGLDASIKGESVTDALGKGLTKGVVDAGVGKTLDAIKGKLPIPKGSSVDVHDYGVGQVLNNNPLTKGIIKTGVRENVVSGVQDKIKGAIVDKAAEEGGFKTGDD